MTGKCNLTLILCRLWFASFCYNFIARKSWEWDTLLGMEKNVSREYPIQDFLRNGKSGGRKEEAHIILEVQDIRNITLWKYAFPSRRVKNPPEHLDQERQNFVKINNVEVQIPLIVSHRLSSRECSKMWPAYVIIDNR